MPKVSTRSLRSLVSKVQPSVFTGAITDSADYIDELEAKLSKIEQSFGGSLDDLYEALKEVFGDESAQITSR